jgi:ComF family protein
MNPITPATLDILHSLLDLVYPQQCLVCGALDMPVVCPVCRSGFESVVSPICRICGRPDTIEDCNTCRFVERTGGWHFDRAVGVARYGGSLAMAIQHLKYHHKELLADPLGNYLVEQMVSEDLRMDDILRQCSLVIPVPLHPQRFRQRGFNQAELLAKPVARALSLPLCRRGLRRLIPTTQQANLPAVERRQNMNRPVFGVPKGVNLSGMGVLLIDDVMTTGATLNAAAGVLKSAGAPLVCCLTLAVGG